jgi:hypothetical protein
LLEKKSLLQNVITKGKNNKLTMFALLRSPFVVIVFLKIQIHAFGLDPSMYIGYGSTVLVSGGTTKVYVVIKVGIKYQSGHQGFRKNHLKGPPSGPPPN